MITMSALQAHYSQTYLAIEKLARANQMYPNRHYCFRGLEEHELQAIERMVGQLTEGELETAVDGEHTEAEDILARHADGQLLDDFLDAIFQGRYLGAAA